MSVSRRWTGALATLTALFTAAGVAAPVAASAAPAGSPSPLPTGTAAAAPAATSHTVTLGTGDRVRVSVAPTGAPSVAVLPADPAAGGEFLSLYAGGHLYVVPQSAASAHGALADPSRFDVTRMVQQTYGADAFPVPAATHRPPPPPGALHTLRVKAFDRRGGRVEGGIVIAFDVDDSDLYIAGQTFTRGEAAFSVPTGHYEVTSFVTTSYRDGSHDISLVTEPEAAVDRSTTVVLDARQARPVRARTPRPSRQVAAIMALDRVPAHGLGFTDALIALDGVALYATPTKPVHTGFLGFLPELRLGDAHGGTDGYVYDLLFPTVGAIGPDLDHTVTGGELATVHARYPSLVPDRDELDLRVPVLPWQISVDTMIGVVHAPVERTEYVLADPDTRWLRAVTPDTDGLTVTMTDVWRTFAPGQQLSTTWLGPAEHPGAQQEDLPLEQACPLCRQGDSLSVSLRPWADSSDGHWALDSPQDGVAASSLALFQDGALVGRGDGTGGTFPMSAAPATYRLVLDASRRSPWWPTSTATHTEWTFPSTERDTDAVPGTWACAAKGGGGRLLAAGGPGGGTCSAEPLMIADYRLPTDLSDTLPAGSTTVMGLDVRHERYAKDSPVTTVQSWVSFDDGRTWTPAPVIAGGPGGTAYGVTFRTPAQGTGSGYVSLRVRATDGAGAAIDQTITRAAALPGAPLPTGEGGTPPPPSPIGLLRPSVVPACAAPAAPDQVRCFALVRTDVTSPNAAAGDPDPAGYGPADLRSAYRLPDGGAHQTIAIVDAFDDPNAESDLADYRAHYGLPPCTTANGCFRKVNQKGRAAPLPDQSAGWGVEISLDLDMASAVCPRCSLLLVEGDSPSILDLATAVDTSVRLGATVVSNSYGSRGELSFARDIEPHYRHPGVAVVVSSGDYGYGNGLPLVGGPAYPASSPYVTAVGGTSLTRAGNARGWTEQAWDGATSGCSAYLRKPAWQHDRLCPGRMVADVSAVADPTTGVAVRDTFGFDGWLVVGGTSAAAPIVAGVYALAGNARTVHYGSAPYRHPDRLFDVDGGTNGTNCALTYLCGGLPGYDGPTGLGSPDGVGAF